MSEGSKKTKDPVRQSKTSADAKPGHEEVYLYRDFGLQERHGAIPWWLKAVSIGLIAWGIYYTIRYWSTS